MSQTRAGRAPDEWGEEPAQNINCYFFFSVCVSVSVTELFEVLPPFFPHPTVSSIRVGGGVVVVVGGRVVVLIVVPKLLLHPLLSSLFL